ncbi:hypothetical protein EYF80_046816 [Liparis tanakae]|uniref:Uncharacterized protein n=1 Tax=Liparis tanakae TaxID=230148 RepID=A0A4Z2FQ06_9TELE|nr:hypothetical protein EYF80_046816 [Liparis tanakae]
MGYNEGSESRFLRVAEWETLQIPLTSRHKDLLFVPVPGSGAGAGARGRTRIIQGLSDESPAKMSGCQKNELPIPFRGDTGMQRGWEVTPGDVKRR